MENRWTIDVIRTLCIAGSFLSGVYSWFGKGNIKYREGLPSICSVQLSKMWMGCGGTVCSLVITFCESCAENDSAVFMIAEGNNNHVSVVFPV